MTTGFTSERAATHDLAVSVVLGELRNRGYDAIELPVDGHRPDAQLADAGGGDYVEIKTSNGQPNLAIEIDSFQEYRRIEASEDRRVYIVWPRSRDPKHWTVHTVDSLVAHLAGGPKRRSGGGSNDDWYLFERPHGTKFNDFFPGVS